MTLEQFEFRLERLCETLLDEAPEDARLVIDALQKQIKEISDDFGITVE